VLIDGARSFGALRHGRLFSPGRVHRRSEGAHRF